ncbi:hypothetical protein G5C65_35685, partial [Streptomyces sp. SB3404]|nr:hypothetical protein [Streptomyces boncukensis]
MRREHRARLVHVGAWVLATGAAVTLSWFGVHTVLAGTDYAPPRALPVSEAPPTVPAAEPSARAQPSADSTHRPKPSRSPSA